MKATTIFGAALCALALAACLPSYTVEADTGVDAGSDAGPGGGPNDPSNCGASGHTCLGGTCVGGACQPFAIATELNRPIAFDVTADQVVLATLDGVAVCPIEGCGDAPPKVIAKASIGTENVLARDGWVYWTDADVGQIQRCKLPACDGGWQVLATELEKPRSLAVEGGDLFFLTGIGNGAGREVRRCPLSGGCAASTTTYTLSDDAKHAVIAGGAITWTTDGGQLWRCSLSSCASDAAVLFFDADPQALAIAEDVVYFGGRAGDVLSCPASGCDLKPAKVASASVIASIAVGAGRVVWSEPDKGTIGALPIDGGDSTTLAAGQLKPAMVLRVGSATYWIDLGNQLAGAPDGQAMRVAD